MEPRLETYLSFDGNCRAAFERYEAVLGAKIEGLTRFADRVKDCAPADAERIIHGVLHLGSHVIRGSDTTTGQPHEAMKGFWLSLHYPTASEARRVFASLAEGGKVAMEIDRTFWAAAFGMVTDRFGVPWMVSSGE
jgi:PhnB protein